MPSHAFTCLVTTLELMRAIGIHLINSNKRIQSIINSCFTCPETKKSVFAGHSIVKLVLDDIFRTTVLLQLVSRNLVAHVFYLRVNRSNTLSVKVIKCQHIRAGDIRYQGHLGQLGNIRAIASLLISAVDK